MKYLFITLISFISFTIYAQELHPQLEAFKNLVGGTWVADGEWGDGSPFEQEAIFEIGLSGNLIKTQTWGNISSSDYEKGLRSEGIRFWDASDSTLKFWEFDVFGSAIKGKVMIDGESLYLSYSYDFGSGPMKLTDAWVFISKDEYEFIVGVFEEGEWKQKYISTPIKRIPDE